MDENIAATYTLIYHFLKQQSQKKAVEAIRKAAKPFVVLSDDMEQEGPSLEALVKGWRTKENIKSDVISSSEDSGSSDDSSSNSEGSTSSDASSEDSSASETSDNDDSDDSKAETKAKKSPPKGVERDTSTTLSSENSRELAKNAIKIPKKSTKDENNGSESDSSDSDSSDSDSPSKSSTSDSSDAETSPSSADSRNSSPGSSGKNEAKINEKAPANTTGTTKDKSSSSPESSTDSEDESGSELRQEEDTHIAKKQRTSESGTAVAITAGASQRKRKPPLKAKERFQRVKTHNLAPELFLDNGYTARGGATNDYGERAHRDLIMTRGAGFRKEKNKKKRGSYRGGEITMENHSIKFDF